MARAKKLAQVRFQKNNADREGYAIEILSDGEWGLESWFPCVAKVGADAIGMESQTDYIHWTFLLKLQQLQNLGYEIHFDV